MAETDPGKQNQRRWSNALSLGTGALVLFNAGLAGYLTFGRAPFLGIAVGEAECTGNLPVVGAWVATASGSGSNYAERVPGPSSTQEVFFKFIPPGQYAVHMGCGGTPAKWEWADYSSELPPNTVVRVVCSPTLGDPNMHGVCVRQPV